MIHIHKKNGGFGLPPSNPGGTGGFFKPGFVQPGFVLTKKKDVQDINDAIRRTRGVGGGGGGIIKKKSYGVDHNSIYNALRRTRGAGNVAPAKCRGVALQVGPQVCAPNHPFQHPPVVRTPICQCVSQQQEMPQSQKAPNKDPFYPWHNTITTPKGLVIPVSNTSIHNHVRYRTPSWDYLRKVDSLK